MKSLFFMIRWFWRNRRWKGTRQKYKQFDRDLAAYMERGVTPW